MQQIAYLTVLLSECTVNSYVIISIQFLFIYVQTAQRQIMKWAGERREKQ
jgi:hypothetical protein